MQRNRELGASEATVLPGHACFGQKKVLVPGFFFLFFFFSDRPKLHNQFLCIRKYIYTERSRAPGVVNLLSLTITMYIHIT